jgi:hypothetical protein
MRRYLLTALALVFSFGLAVAAEVVFLGYDKDAKELKVKDGDKEITYKITDDTVFKQGDKDYPAEKALSRLDRMNEKGKGKAKMDVTGKGGKATEVKFPAFKRKKDKE